MNLASAEGFNLELPGFEKFSKEFGRNNRKKPIDGNGSYFKIYIIIVLPTSKLPNQMNLRC
jgi:hypothetical protein